MIIVGDINVHLENPDDIHAEQFTELLTSFGLTQHVDSPTHNKGEILDLLITLSDCAVENLRVDPPIISDHSVISGTLPHPSPPGAVFTTRQVRGWKKLDHSAVRRARSRPFARTQMGHHRQPLVLWIVVSVRSNRAPRRIFVKIIQSAPVKSCDLDPAPTFFIKDFLDCLLSSITRMCNVSLKESCLPLITQRIKKPGLDRDDVNNYRPISNLTFMSKVIKKIVAKQLIAYLVANNLVPKLQSGFRSGHSTETAILRVLSDIYSSIDQDRSSSSLCWM